jgi:hypothetical protein
MRKWLSSHTTLQIFRHFLLWPKESMIILTRAPPDYISPLSLFRREFWNYASLLQTIALYITNSSYLEIIASLYVLVQI